VWRQHGVVSETHAGHILELYETSSESVDRRRSRAVFTLMSLAASLVGLAALLLIAYNWQALGRSLKLAIVLGVVTGTHAGAYYMRYRRGARLASEIAFFLGCDWSPTSR